jgi:MFS family permease
VPIFLKDSFHLRSPLIGFVMTIDNILAIVLLPYLGALSDRTRTRLGWRRPYILAGSVLALIFFLFMPWVAALQRLGLMMLIIILMNLSMALFRSPVIALMPDITPSRFRSQANGIINFMGGLGALLVFFGGKPLYDRRVSLPFLVGGSAPACWWCSSSGSRPRPSPRRRGASVSRIPSEAWPATSRMSSVARGACCPSCWPSSAGSWAITPSKLSSPAMPSITWACRNQPGS